MGASPEVVEKRVQKLYVDLLDNYCVISLFDCPIKIFEQLCFQQTETVLKNPDKLRRQVLSRTGAFHKSRAQIAMIIFEKSLILAFLSPPEAAVDDTLKNSDENKLCRATMCGSCTQERDSVCK